MMILIPTPEGDFPRPLPDPVYLEDWTNFDKAFRALWEWMQSDAQQLAPGLFEAISLTDLEVQLIWESHTSRGPRLHYMELREAFSKC